MEDTESRFDQLRRDMAAAARISFAAYREQHPDEDFFAFGLFTGNEVVGAVAAANTEQYIQRAIQESAEGAYDIPEMGQMRYCPMEWAYCGAEGEAKEQWSRILEMQYKLRLTGNLLVQAYQEKALETMILALGDLDAEGFFGTGAERERVILVIWVAESDDTEKWWIRSAKELNPQAVYERFLSELPSWCQYEGETLEPSQARSDDAEARQEAAGALWERGAPAIPTLVELLEDATPAVRARAASSLGLIGTEAKAAMPAMVPLLADPDVKVCWDTRQALLDLCWGASDAGCDLSPEATAVVPVLIELLAHERADTRRTAAHVLGALGPYATAAVPALLGLLEDEDECVRDGATGALARIGSETPDAVPLGKLTDLLRHDDEGVREAASGTLSRMGAGAIPAVPVALELLKDPDPGIRADAAGLLGCIGADAETAVPALTALLEEEDFGVLYQAIYALGAFGAAAEPAVAILAKLTAHEQAGVISARTLAEIGPAAKAAVPALVERLQDERSWIRSSAAHGLGGIGPEAAVAIPALERAAEGDEDERVRQAATEAIEVIQGKRPRPVRETPTDDVD